MKKVFVELFMSKITKIEIILPFFLAVLLTLNGTPRLLLSVIGFSDPTSGRISLRVSTIAEKHRIS